MHLWGILTGELLRSYLPDSADSRYVLTHDTADGVQLWDTETGELVGIYGRRCRLF